MTMHLCPSCIEKQEVECENESRREDHYGVCPIHGRIKLVENHKVVRKE